MGAMTLGSLRVLYTSEGIEKLNSEVERFRADATQRFGTVATSAGIAFTAVGAAITGVTALGIKEAVSWESAFTGVKKTVNGTEEELALLEQQIRDMSLVTPVPANDLAQIAESAGQLGIKKESILGFTQTVADLSVTTNIAGESGASMIAQFANITQLDQSQFRNLASAIVDLGNNGASTEAEILAMSMRLAGAGEAAGLAEPEILGIGSALSSVGIEAEAGGSAFSKVMIDIASAVDTGSEKVQQFADVAGMSADEFARKFKEAPAEAIIAFVEGLGKVESRGKSLFVVLQELGIEEVRMRDALLRASGAGDLLRESIERGNTAFKENTALTKEAELRYGTTESQIVLLKNEFAELSRSLGELLLPALIKVVSGAGDFISKANEFVDAHPTISTALVGVAGGFGALSLAIGPVLYVLPQMYAGFQLIKGLAFGAAMAETATAVTSVGTAATVATPALTGVGAAGAAATIGLAPLILAVAAATASLVFLGAIAIKFHETIVQLGESQQRLEQQTGAYANQLEALGVKVDRVAMAEMSLGEQRAYLITLDNERNTSGLLAYMQTLTTREQADAAYTVAKNLMMNESFTMEEAAKVALMNLDAARLNALLHANATETQSILETLGIREKATKKTATEVEATNQKIIASQGNVGSSYQELSARIDENMKAWIRGHMKLLASNTSVWNQLSTHHKQYAIQYQQEMQGMTQKTQEGSGESKGAIEGLSDSIKNLPEVVGASGEKAAQQFEEMARRMVAAAEEARSAMEGLDMDVRHSPSVNDLIALSLTHTVGLFSAGFAHIGGMAQGVRQILAGALSAPVAPNIQAASTSIAQAAQSGTFGAQAASIASAASGNTAAIAQAPPSKSPISGLNVHINHMTVE